MRFFEGEPPRRLCSLADDPWFHPSAQAAEQVTLDGRRVERVFRVDLDAGKLWRYGELPRGDLSTEWPVEELVGAIEIHWPGGIVARSSH